MIEAPEFWLIIVIALVAPYISLAFIVGAFEKRNRHRRQSVDKRSEKKSHLSVSVFIPTFNEERLIGRKLDNLFLQTFEVMEILVYDCSTDKTPIIVREYQKRHPNIKLIIQPERIGAARTFNQALSEAIGDIFIKTDADVILKSPTAIEDLVSNFYESSIGGASAVYEKEKGMERYYRSIMTKVQLAESNIDSTLIAHTGLLAFRKSVMSPVDSDSMAEDTEEFILIRKKGFRTIVDSNVKAEEEVPDSFALRRKQRDRRAQGIVKAMMKNKEIFFNPKFGNYGAIVFPMELFIIGISPFLALALGGVLTFLLYQIHPGFLGLLAIPAGLLLTKSKIFYSVVDTQISGLVATFKYVLHKDEPLWSKVR